MNKILLQQYKCFNFTQCKNITLLLKQQVNNTFSYTTQKQVIINFKTSSLKKNYCLNLKK